MTTVKVSRGPYSADNAIDISLFPFWLDKIYPEQMTVSLQSNNDIFAAFCLWTYSMLQISAKISIEQSILNQITIHLILKSSN